MTPTNCFVYIHTMKEIPEHLPKPTEAELELLTVLWEKGEASVRELHEVVSRERAIGYTSVLKTLQIMTEKGLVEREEAGKAHIYRAAASQEETQNQLLRDLSARLFSGSAAQLAMHALSMEPASEEELEEIRRLIRKKREKQ
ncbi:MAG TPA: BlaI/MecI/CopY family transcriptional regulator [Silvibacterium sp.]|nr:BlaI/MecI/CopY family transcriptional regulator [Silvibacterium sp.]